MIEGKIKVFAAIVLLLGFGLALNGKAMGQTLPLPSINIGIGKASDPGEVAISLQILILLTVLSLAPAILVMLTSFARIIVVLSFLRQAIGTQQMPPNQILIGLALFLSFFIMAPVWQRINSDALQPYLARQISQDEAVKRAAEPIRKFMFRQTRQKDLALFVEIAGSGRPKDLSEIPTYTVIPAFMISELKTAFQIGFLLYVPFLVLDMVIASVLLSMGMLMLPPILISLPFKVLLFVLVDGWYLVVGSLVKSFQ